MKKLRFIYSFLIVISLLTVLPFFNNKFFYTQDYIFIARLNQMSTALSDGQFPVRWAPDLRYGEPVFNFYASLPYYIGAVIHLLGLNFIWVSKILFILSSVLSAITMYILGNRLFGKRGGILAAVLYTYAPYRAVDMYVRGSLSETWAFIFFPLIFYSSVALAEKLNAKNLSLLALSLAGLFLTHNVTTLMFLPFLALWWIYLIFKVRQWKVIAYLFLGFILGFGVAASFLLPSFFERDFIQTQYLTAGYFNFRIHFVAVRQFFSLFFGYGSSVWGPDDGLSFQVGLINWVMLVVSGILGFIHRKDKKMLGLLVILNICFILSIFLQHTKSDFIWEAIPLMAFIQFPWRFLSITIFTIALIGGAVAPYLKNKLSPVYFLLIITAVISTLTYFKPKEYVNDSFFDKFLNKEKMHQGIDLTKDYLPIWVHTTDAPPLNYPEAEKGRIEVSQFEKKTGFASSRINVLEDSIIEVPITYFPEWVVLANQKLINQENPSKRGVIRFKLPKGSYNLEFEFKDTPVRMIANIISLSGAVLLAAFLILKRTPKND